MCVGALVPAAALAGMPRAVASGRPLLLPPGMALALVATCPMLPLASVGATLLLAYASSGVLGRLNGAARRRSPGLDGAPV